MKVCTKLSKKVVFFSVIPIAARFLDDLFMFNKASTCTSNHIYPNSMDLIFLLMLEALSGGTIAVPVAGGSKFHILDMWTKNFFLLFHSLSFFY